MIGSILRGGRSLAPKKWGLGKCAKNIKRVLLVWLFFLQSLPNATDANDVMLSAPNVALAAQGGESAPVPLSRSGMAEILIDKVYLYSRFDVLFKTPFLPEENVRIREVSAAETSRMRAQRGQASFDYAGYEGVDSSQVLRTEKLGYSRYRDAKGRQCRAFILGFSAQRAGLHLLPSLRFEAIESGRIWYAPTLPFAAFQVDEGELALPVDVSRNALSKIVYLGQNILLHLTAERVETIDQSFLPHHPEFRNFLVQESPAQREIERLKILGEDVYRVALGSWLLNPIEPGLLQIPVISASIMGRERTTPPHQIEVLPLPPSPYLPAAKRQGIRAAGAAGGAVAIGDFGLSFVLRSDGPPARPQIEPKREGKAGKEERKPGAEAAKNGQMDQMETGGKNPDFAPEFAEDARIRAVLRISGSGNIHILSFPAVNASSNLVLLQTEERDSLDASGDELFGWREKEFVYRAKSPGNYELRAEPFPFFDPQQSLWRRESAQKLAFAVINQKSRSYYLNLKDLHFSRIVVFASNILYGLQEYAFYGCLAIFLLTSLYCLRPRPRPVRSFKLRLEHSRLAFLVLGMVFVAWLYSFALRKYVAAAEREQQYYFSLLGDTPYGVNLGMKLGVKLPGNLPNLALSMYRDSRVLEALEVAYLYYFRQPLYPPARRLVSSLRIEQGLSPVLPGAFFWGLQLRQIGRYLALFCVILLSSACIVQKRRTLQKENARRENHILMEQPLRFGQGYRNYAIFVVLLLFAIAIPWRFSLAVTIAPGTPLMPIPSSAGQAIETDESKHLRAGELVKISGRMEDTDILVVGEEQKKGWVEGQSLFFLPEY